MHILFLADAVFSDLPGGSRVVARELARGLVARGHSVTCLVGRQNAEAPEAEEQEGVQIIRYAGAGRAVQFVQAGRAACEALWRKKPFDIVHTHFAYAAVGPLGVVPRGVPHVRTFHGPWDEEGWVEDMAGTLGVAGHVRARFERGVRFHIEHSNLRHSRRVLVLSDYFAREVRERFGVPEPRLKKIPGGVDLRRFKPVLDRSVVRARLGLPTDRPILLTVRRLAPRMGLDRLLQALPAIVALHPTLLLLIGGKGPERECLEETTRRLGLTGNVRFLGFLPDNLLPSYFQAADLFVLPTQALEGFGLVTVEALASGTPVVGTPVGATPEILAPLEERLITCDVTPDAIAEGILSFLGSGWARRLTPSCLHQYVRDHYSWDKHIEAVEQVYQEVTSTKC